MKENLVMLYAKLPRMGNTKTRIARESNELFAWLVSACSFQDTINKLSQSKDYDFIVIVDSEEESVFLKKNFNLHTYVLNIRTKDQSERFAFLFRLFEENYNNIILIPGDVPSLTKETLTNALEALNKREYVFGPEYNGGVYLIGMSGIPKSIFNNVRWSTENSLKDLIKNTNRKCSLLGFKGDLNVVSDLKIFYEDIKSNSFLLYNVLMELKFYEKMEEIVNVSY